MNDEAINKGSSNFGGSSGAPSRRLQLVRAGASQFGIFVDEIAVVVPWQEPAPLPHAPNAVLGVVSIQGRMFTVLDLATLLVADATLGDEPRKTPEYLIALRGDEQLALAIEAPGKVVQLPSGSIEDSITKQETSTTPLLGVWQREESDIKILNPKGLFPAAIQGRQRRRRRF